MSAVHSNASSSWYVEIAIKHVKTFKISPSHWFHTQFILINFKFTILCAWKKNPVGIAWENISTA